MMTRRSFLKSLAVSGALLVSGRPLKVLAQTAFVPTADTLLMKTIPVSGETIPAMGLGTARAFDDASPPFGRRKNLKDVLKLFYERGGRVVDTSPFYGDAETLTGDLARELGLNEKLFMATKVWEHGNKSGIRQMNESFERLGVTVMDLFQVHNMHGWRTHLPTLRKWKEEGRIRYLGITHGREDALDKLEEIMKAEPLDFIQINYSLSEPEAGERVLPLARDKGIAVIANRPFAAGKFFKQVEDKALPGWAVELGCETWAQFSLKYIISHPAVTCTIPATSKPEHLLSNMKAGAGPMPDAPARRKMAAFFKALA